MKSVLFQKFLLEDARENRWTHVYTDQELFDLINAATPEEINYIPTEGEHVGKSVLWLVARHFDFINDVQYRVFEHLLRLSNKDAINSSAKTYDIGMNELDNGTSVLSLVVRKTSSVLSRQFRLTATLLEKDARVGVDREMDLFQKISRIYKDMILFSITYNDDNFIGLKEKIARIQSRHNHYAFIFAHLSTLCRRYMIDKGLNSDDDIQMAGLLTSVVNDFVNGVSTVVNETLSSYKDSLEPDDINTLRVLLQMFASEQGEVLLNYVNNTTLLRHELLSTPQQVAAEYREQKRTGLAMSS